MDTVSWQRIEGGLVFLSALVLFVYLGGGIVWWLAIIVFLAPDISFAAYALGPKVGALLYNLVHVFAFGSIVLAAGVAFGSPTLSALGALWLAHSGFDRMLGYGLKSPEAFNMTHLGRIGRRSSEP
ncbi:DUF4260 family protein [Paracoccus suum]|uniref:DUF4260 family protein n=1 Tax=Paracoccus suum TaxID=2259340 RepID=A0A344PM71_9RHOB|nr:DUF4260 domain-containing protein [Paracoccus suum]AXC50476.1 DUF4260 family protein [Paracoccus suum]